MVTNAALEEPVNFFKKRRISKGFFAFSLGCAIGLAMVLLGIFARAVLRHLVELDRQEALVTKQSLSRGRTRFESGQTRMTA